MLKDSPARRLVFVVAGNMRNSEVESTDRHGWDEGEEESRGGVSIYSPPVEFQTIFYGVISRIFCKGTGRARE